ncbi:FAD-dependent oxidoreductase [Hominifimenecus sp. rT4P-3]|uniref:FAD-dependent oxidoreductase n=1 Tax=Hominifimenecus sp. rT4P-3 TaxID=3242979 RepID=UPI003DA576F8
MKQYDVIVVGGGTAGFAAAVTAAKAGKNTLLIEENAYLGGTATGAQISQFMGFANDETEESLRGLVKELLSRLKAAKGSQGMSHIYLSGDKNLDVSVIPYQPDILKDIMDDMVSEAGVDILLHTRVIGAQMTDGKISSLTIHNVEGVQSITGRIVIDATFHGSVAVACGCQWKMGDEDGVLQPGTLIYQIAGVDAERYAKVTQSEKTALAKKGLEQGCLYVNNLLARPLPNGVFQSNMSRVKINPLDTLAWSKAEMEARRQVRKISRFFIENVPGFEHAYLVTTGDFTGLRDSRRIMGQYVLSNEDVLEGHEFPDAVAKSSYPIDIHDANGVGSHVVKPKTGVFYVPYRAMIVKEASNLVLAGRCISAEHEAHACIRVMITCMRLGEAAAMAAAESLNRGCEVNTLDGSILKEQLLG